MLTLLIIDDEAPARSRLRRMLATVPDCEVLGEAVSGTHALELIDALHPDAVLLDISMPGLDGMSVAERVKTREKPPAVIFCTAHADYALKAFDSEAVDYLVKPVTQDRLSAAIDRARRFLGVEPSEAFLAAVLGGTTELVALGDVACFHAEDKYTTVYMNERALMINQSLAEIEEKYPERFLRVHRNALVAKDRIRGLERSEQGARLLLGGCDFQPQVSRRQLPAVRRLLKEMQ